MRKNNTYNDEFKFLPAMSACYVGRQALYNFFLLIIM